MPFGDDEVHDARGWAGTKAREGSADRQQDVRATAAAAATVPHVKVHVATVVLCRAGRLLCLPISAKN